MKLNSGYITSGLFHGGVVFAAVIAGWLVASPPSPKSPETGVGRVIVIEGAAGAGNDAGPAAKPPSSATALPVITAPDARRILAEYDKNMAERRALEERRPAAVTPPVKPVTEVTTTPRSRPTSPAVGGKISGAPRVTEIIGARVTTTDGVAPGAVSGIPGRPAGGGEKSSADEIPAFSRDLGEKFSAAYRPLFRRKGGSLTGDSASGVLRLIVSPSGIVRFDRWESEPADPLFSEILREALSAMEPVSPPPGGEETIVLLPVSGTVVG